MTIIMTITMTITMTIAVTISMIITIINNKDYTTLGFAESVQLLFQRSERWTSSKQELQAELGAGGIFFSQAILLQLGERWKRNPNF